MGWNYGQESGIIRKDGIYVDKGYSGHGDGVNNPALEATPNVGPIPKGSWIIEGPPFDHPKCGPYCLRLVPKQYTMVFGRSGFLIHGDEKEHPGEFLASDGCIIMPRATRSRIWQSGDNQLEVIA